MLLLISTTHQPATDLGFLLHKNPARMFEADLTFGRARVFYPEATPERCTAALHVEVDTLELVRSASQAGRPGFEHYVNDRAYAASSLLSSAMTKCFGTAMSGRSKERPDLVEAVLPLEVRLPVLPARGGEAVIRALFEPLSYEVTATTILLDDKFPEWGPSRYFDVTLRGNLRMKDMLEHLFVLVPVLDDYKHYWVGSDEIEKLLRKGGDWLASHPNRNMIVQRYLRYQPVLTRDALARLTEGDPDREDDEKEEVEAKLESKVSLHDMRIAAVVEKLKESGAASVLDLGCGEGRLLQKLLKERAFKRILGMDVSLHALDKAKRKLRWDRLSPSQLQRLTLLHSSLVYFDERLSGFDAAAAIEVIEHLDPDRLDTFERLVFAEMRPGTVIVTTPNREYNALFEGMTPGAFRHRDHRFEWAREEFRAWSDAVCAKFGYSVERLPIGDEDPTHGPPTQMAVFKR